MGDRSRGLYEKFSKIERTDGEHRPGGRHDGCAYFVLDVTHDPYAVPALRAYADSAEADGYAYLAADLREMARVAEERGASGGLHCSTSEEVH